MPSPLRTTALLALVQLSSARLYTSTTSATVLLPPAPTGESDEDVWASVLDEHDSTTEYLLACPTAFSASPAKPQDCQGPYAGATLTYAPAPSGLTKVTLADVEYNCALDESGVVCQTIEGGIDERIEIAGDQTEEWTKTITVVSTLEVDGFKVQPRFKAARAAEPASTATFSPDLEDEFDGTELSAGKKGGSGSSSGGKPGKPGKPGSGGGNKGNNTDDDENAASTTGAFGLGVMTTLLLSVIVAAAVI